MTNIRPAVYAYDPSGNIDSILKSLGTAQISTNFDYNAVNPCTRIANLFPGGTRTFEYKYDEMNNRTGVSRDRPLT